MHFLLSAVGTSGDVFPLIGIAAALRRRGHEATLVANDIFEPHARRHDIEFLSIGTQENFKQVFDDPRIWDWRQGWPLLCSEVLIPAIQPTYEIARERYVPGKTVLLGNVMAYGARIAQETLGAPLATLHISPSCIRTMHDAALAHPYFIRKVPSLLIRYQYWLADLLVIDREVRGPVNRFRAQFGLKPASRFLGQWIQSPDLIIGLFPEWFGPPQPDWPKQAHVTGYIDYDGRDLFDPPAAMEEFLAAGDPPIVFTAGSAMLDCESFFRESIEACRILGRRGMLMTAFPERIPKDLPPTVIPASAPYTWLLPKAAAFVHHAGAGSLARGLAAGVPQLAMPMAYDQPDNADRLKKLGVGTTITRGSYRAKNVAEKLRALLESSDVLRRCREIADRFQGHDPLTETCRLVEALGQKHAGKTSEHATGWWTGGGVHSAQATVDRS